MAKAKRPYVRKIKVGQIVLPWDELPDGMKDASKNTTDWPVWTQEDWEAADNETKDLFLRYFQWSYENDAVYTAVFSDKEECVPYVFIEIDGKNTYSLVDTSDENACHRLNTVFGLDSIESLTATMKKDGSIRSIDIDVVYPEVPPDPYVDDPMSDPFYGDEPADS